MTDKKGSLIVLTGPTAAGKTELSVALAKKIDGEIISADSVQVYKHMDIGSAKITKAEMQGIPHHLIDICEPVEAFSIARFKELAKEAATEIHAKGKIPIVAGGTGFYIQSLIYDIDFKETAADGTRTKYEELLKKKGEAYLHALLKEKDPEAAAKIHPNNTKRVIRALEYFEQTGTKISTHNEEERQKKSPYNFAYFVLNLPRETLYDRINRRVDRMIEAGLLDEVKSLVGDYGVTEDMVSMQALGYKELLAYLNGSITLKDAIYTIKRDTRHFAKRQLTWFKREREVIWLDKEEHETLDGQLAFIMEHLRNKKII
ncbi:MAG: tRNA (adenosine(37)-N6)-dimethylallyltransferase MiaA [Clostridium sp.]|nr:tRNA (adenosine(37)-N6)-dimethylallyltransferase MiaA [Clostridium sp.]MCM1208472.1 tRNA (adenosine(37)-N6)-dimethylallyltransferase MiaA [Ruminococcus sp.]